jgi:hypothetical protein
LQKKDSAARHVAQVKLLHLFHSTTKKEGRKGEREGGERKK